LANSLRIAVDAMGGDHGPSLTVSALLESLSHHSNVSALLFGDRDELSSQLKKSSDASLLSRIEIRHSDCNVTDTDKPSAVIRNKRDSSMGLALQAVANDEADAFVSAGNTGAIMALGLYYLKTLPGISRPAICTAIPTSTGRSYVLDLGANLDCSSEQLYQFGLLGSLMAVELDGIDSPVVRLLNVGEEDNKGHAYIQDAASLLESETLINYCGYIEGNGIFEGGTDVVVCDGFSGNIALKTSEGLIAMVTSLFRDAVGNSWLAKLALGLLKTPLLKLKAQLDPAIYNGAYFLGLNGVVVKSHGRASRSAFVRAIDVAIDAAEHNLPEVLSPILKQKMDKQINVEDI
jgi:glycerol-3-phosphate acyltransferase PlsX